MIVHRLPAEHYLEKINKNEPFSLTRFGDGEVLCMFNPTFFNSRPIYKDWILSCGPIMKQIFINNYAYYHCFLDCTFWTRGPHRGDAFINFLNETCPTTEFYDGEFWQNLSFTNRITEITSAIDPYGPVFIGGKHLENMKLVTGITSMQNIIIDDDNGYLDKDRVRNTIIKKFGEGSRMFCFSASILSKVLIDELYPMIGDTCFLIDFGSVFDPYCGILSRSNMVTVGFDKFQPYTKLPLK
jgi:hypothetical protein